MKKENSSSLISLINEWNPGCNYHCSFCAWGVIWKDKRHSTCPLDIVKNMVYTKERVPKDWEQLHG